MMTTDLSRQGGFEPLDEAALKLIRSLPAQWSPIYETLSKIERQALIGLVEAGFAECRADVRISKKHLFRTQHFHLLYSFSGGGRKCEDLWKARIRKDTGVQGVDFIRGRDVWEFAITADGENARQFLDLAPSMVIYQFRYGEPDFNCCRFELRTSQHQGAVAQAAAQAVASNVNNIQINVPPSPAPIVNVVMNVTPSEVPAAAATEPVEPRSRVPDHGAGTAARPSTNDRPDKTVLLQSILWKHHFNDDDDSTAAIPMKPAKIVYMMKAEPGWSSSAVSLLFTKVFGGYHKYRDLAENNHRGLREKLKDSISWLPRTDGNDSVSRFTVK